MWYDERVGKHHDTPIMSLPCAVVKEELQLHRSNNFLLNYMTYITKMTRKTSFSWRILGLLILCLPLHLLEEQ